MRSRSQLTTASPAIPFATALADSSTSEGCSGVPARIRATSSSRPAGLSSASAGGVAGGLAQLRQPLRRRRRCTARHGAAIADPAAILEDAAGIGAIEQVEKLAAEQLDAVMGVAVDAAEIERLAQYETFIGKFAVEQSVDPRHKA